MHRKPHKPPNRGNAERSIQGKRWRGSRTRLRSCWLPSSIDGFGRPAPANPSTTSTEQGNTWHIEMPRCHDLRSRRFAELAHCRKSNTLTGMQGKPPDTSCFPRPRYEALSNPCRAYEHLDVSHVIYGVGSGLTCIHSVQSHMLTRTLGSGPNRTARSWGRPTPCGICRCTIACEGQGPALVLKFKQVMLPNVVINGSHTNVFCDQQGERATLGRCHTGTGQHYTSTYLAPVY